MAGLSVFLLQKFSDCSRFSRTSFSKVPDFSRLFPAVFDGPRKSLDIFTDKEVGKNNKIAEKFPDKKQIPSLFKVFPDLKVNSLTFPDFADFFQISENPECRKK